MLSARPYVALPRKSSGPEPRRLMAARGSSDDGGDHRSEGLFLGDVGTAEELRAAGYSVSQLHDAGCPASELLAIGFMPADLCRVGVPASAMVAAKATICRATGGQIGNRTDLIATHYLLRVVSCRKGRLTPSTRRQS